MVTLGHPTGDPAVTGRPGAMADATVHEGIPYSTPGELAERLVPILRPALDAHEPVIAVLDEATHSALHVALGDTADAIEFLDPAEAYKVPSFTVAVRWARLTRRAGAPGGRTTVVGQHVEGLPDCGPDYWARLDAALNVALHGLPITMLCPFPDGLEARARNRATHRSLLAGDRSEPSPDYRDPSDVVADYPPPPPPDLGPPAAEQSFVLTGLPGVRHLVSSVAVGTGLDPERVADFVLAVNEIASNSVEHGPGSGVLRLWALPSSIVAEVFDDGRMSVAFPGLVAPSPSGERGRGLWLASELSDVLQVWSDAEGTIIRVSMAL